MNRDLENVSGLAELGRVLDSIPLKLQTNVMRGAMRAGAKVIATKAKELAPTEAAGTYSKYKSTLGWKPGELQRSIRQSAKIVGDKVVSKVSAGNKKAYYAHMVEFGTAAHVIEAREGNVLLAGNTFTRGVKHPGARANPFMRIAMDSQAWNAVERVGEYIRARLTKEGLNTPDNGGNQ